MKAEQKSVVVFLQQQETKFIIPVYQRNYDWKIEQCSQLLHDIRSVALDDKQNSHFIGSIVYLHDDVYTSGPRELTIIDGQQRLTTLTLIWLALYHKAKQKNDNKTADKFYRKYIINEYLEDEEKLKLKPTQNNNSVFLAIVRGDHDATITEYSRLIENYNFFFETIKSDEIEIVEKGIGKLLFVEVSLERGKDDPQKIFQSLNSTGLDLSEGDLIRNYVLMDLKSNDQKRIYEHFWLPIEKMTTDTEMNKSKISDYIRDYLTFKNRDIPNKNKVFETFKKFCANKEIDNLKVVLTDIKKYAGYYNLLINPANETDSAIRMKLVNIQELEVSVTFPFLLQIYNDFKTRRIDTDTFLRVFDLVESFVWRRFICGLPTNALNKIFMRLYEDIKDFDQDKYIQNIELSLLNKRGSQRFPTNDEVRKELLIKDIYNSKTKNIFYLLSKLENFNNNEKVDLENKKITIEHIFPQNPDPKWKIELGDTEYSRMKNYLNSIANLTLTGNNTSLSNRYFTDKQDLPEKGYRSSRLFLNKFLAQCDIWNEQNLLERFEIIFSKFKEIWYYPDVYIKNDEYAEEINIMEDIDPTNKKIDYVIFFNQKIPNINFRNLLIKVVSTLFDLEPAVFIDTALGVKLNFTKDQTKLRAGEQIPYTSYFIETNCSGKEIFNRIRMILEKFDFTDELYIKFKENERE